MLLYICDLCICIGDTLLCAFQRLGIRLLFRQCLNLLIQRIQFLLCSIFFITICQILDLFFQLCLLFLLCFQLFRIVFYSIQAGILIFFIDLIDLLLCITLSAEQRLILLQITAYFGFNILCDTAILVNICKSSCIISAYIESRILLISVQCCLIPLIANQTCLQSQC